MFGKQITGKLCMQRAFEDLLLFFPHVKGELMGVVATYVDDTLLTGSQAFKYLNARPVKRF